MPLEATLCDFHPCQCGTASEEAVDRDGKRFCGERCAEGRGCDHHDCNCGAFPQEEPPPR